MSKRNHGKFKLDRKVGESLRGGLRSSISQSFNAPGQHGAKPKVRVSDYGIKMIAKQKLKFYYANLTESKLRKVYKRALAYKGDVSSNFLRLIESRLDVLVYRANLCASFMASRQLINHGHVLVNGVKVTVCSYLCKRGDVFRIAPSSINFASVKGAVLGSSCNPPRYIDPDYKHLVFKLISLPSVGDMCYPTSICPELVMEYYSGLS
ncbi:30S ribosomal protein S4 [Candidatus Hodgkinia cicadicola]